MTTSAARIGQRLLRELERADDGRSSIADVCRRVGRAAERYGLLRPSYERVRQLVHARRAQMPTVTTAEVVLDVLYRTRPPQAPADHLLGIDQD